MQRFISLLRNNYHLSTIKVMLNSSLSLSLQLIQTQDKKTPIVTKTYLCEYYYMFM